MRDLGNNMKTSNINWDNKKEWVNKRKELYRRIMTSKYIPDISKQGYVTTPRVYGKPPRPLWMVMHTMMEPG